MLTSLKYSRPDGTYVGIVNDMPYHVTMDTPYWLDALELAAIEMPPEEPVYAFPQPPYIPQTISRFQARAGLMQRGLLADVEALVANSTPLAQLAWAETIEWRRDSPTLNALAKDGLDLTDAEIDELFIAAAEIKA